MIRFGLCCIFKEEPIRFGRATAGFLLKFSPAEQRERLSKICLANAQSLFRALEFCRQNGIGCFRINSQILPLKTHPDLGYDVSDLPHAEAVMDIFKACGRFCRDHDIRTTFHPDQFIVLSSPHADVVTRSVADLEYQAEVAGWVNADAINIHAGGVYGDKPSALKRLRKTIEMLSDPVRKRLTLENDDKSYSPRDLLPVCEDMQVPLTYDVHHHRCLKDGLTVEQATAQAAAGWNREPLFHLSSPEKGWESGAPRNHHDYIDVRDLPKLWLSMDITVEVEAKAKELAVLRLMKALKQP
jgi:UV DNA damage endonuclease